MTAKGPLHDPILAEIAAGYPYREVARRLNTTLGTVAGVGTRSKKPKVIRAAALPGNTTYDETKLTETWADRKARRAVERAAT